MKKKIAIVGGGAASLMLALKLDTNKFDVTIYERNKALGRKFLVAGDGGLNLTHSNPSNKFLLNYSPLAFIEEAFNSFTNDDFVNFLNDDLGIETFVGSSGKIFPIKSIKPIAVLKAFENAILKNKVDLKFDYLWNGFAKNGNLLFNQSSVEVEADIKIFCLGGASWKVTGSDGEWKKYFEEKLILCKNFEASNCSFKINWGKNFIERNTGKALKNCSYRVNSKTVLGESVITAFGIEGNGVYPLSQEIRKSIVVGGGAKLIIDFKPSFSEEKVFEKLSSSHKKNNSEILKTELNLSTVQLSLLKNYLSKNDFLDFKLLANTIKNFIVDIKELAPIDEAISTVGGIDLSEIDKNFMLKKMPNHYCIGEMIDFDAPTGGYLLQSCFSMGFYLAHHINRCY